MSLSENSYNKFNSACGDRIYAMYDNVSKKVIVAYCSYDDNNYRSGNITLGTVEEDNVVFNEPKIISNDSIFYPSLAYDSDNNKVIVAYRYAVSNKGMIKLGTVSDNDIVLNDGVIFSEANPSHISVSYNKVNQKVIIAYAELSDKDYGVIRVGNIYNNNIELDKPITFDISGIRLISMVYDGNSDKLIIAYYDYGKKKSIIKVGTLINNSIVFSNEVIFNNDISYYMSMAYDHKNKKVIIAYVNSNSDGKGMVRVGTVNDNNIVLGDPVVFNEYITKYTSMLYDPINGKVFIAYHNDSDTKVYNDEDYEEDYYYYNKDIDQRYDYETGTVSGCIITGTVTENNVVFSKPITFSETSTCGVSLVNSHNNKVVVVYHDGYDGYGTAKVINVEVR